MKSLLSLLLLGIAVEAGAAGKPAVYRYVQQLAEITPIPLAEIVGASYFRLKFPQSYGSQDWHSYFTQRHARGKSYEEAQEFSLLMFGNRAPLDEEEAIALLMADPVYRAHVVGHIWTAANILAIANNELGGEICPHCGEQYSPEELVYHLFGIGDGDMAFGKQLVPLLLAIDGDKPMHKLFDEIGEINLHSFAIRYRGKKLDVIGHANNHGNYLVRHSHVRHPPLLPYHLDQLQQFGYDRHTMQQLLPTDQLIPALISHRALPTSFTEERQRIGIFDFALAVDLLLEAGIVAPGSSPTVIQEALHAGKAALVVAETNAKDHHPVSVMQVLLHATGQKETLQALAREFGMEASSSKFADHLNAIEDLANDSQQPASLFQIVQLSRLGFTLEEILALSYDARDAVIVSDPKDREDFIANINATLFIEDFNPVAINDLVKKTGALVFVLLNKDYRLQKIEPHHSSMYKELAW